MSSHVDNSDLSSLSPINEDSYWSEFVRSEEMKLSFDSGIVEKHTDKNYMTIVVYEYRFNPNS